MFEPGAKMSTHEPKLEKLERASDDVDDATVIASGARAGEPLHAFEFSLPAATTMVTPALVALRIAVSVAVDAPPPRLMFATDGPEWFCATQFMPETTPESEPEPSQPSTRTATSRTFLA